jgi:hypothetical protein
MFDGGTLEKTARFRCTRSTPLRLPMAAVHPEPRGASVIEQGIQRLAAHLTVSKYAEHKPGLGHRKFGGAVADGLR